ncbi:MAG: SH3 domain-containing protein [Gemella sp.]|nr:SH3 domain-containing protein [Gemella sp.]
MEKIIYQDDIGLYFVEYDQNGNPSKVYCDETGTPIVSEEENTLEIFQQEDGTYYYVAYNELGEAYKVPCDENGNELVEITQGDVEPFVAPVPPLQNEQVAHANQTDGAGFVSATATANYQNQAAPVQEKSGSKVGIIAALVALPLLFGGGYYAYSEFLAKPVVKMEGFVVDVKFTGKDGQGKVDANITAIPDVKISDTVKQEAVDDLLTNAEVTYTKESGLKNGDKVGVNIDIDTSKAEAVGVKVEGDFKKTVTVDGLTDSDSKSSSSDSKSNYSKENSNNSDTKKESSEEPKKLEYKQVYNTGNKGLLMRRGPSQSYPAITTLFDGTPVQILEYDGSWAKVNYNGTQGWMHISYLR